MKKIAFLVAIAMAFTVSFVFAQFDGTPPAPLPFQNHPDYASFDVQVHSRDYVTWHDDALESDGNYPGNVIQSEHGTDCSAPPATHSNGSYSGAVFICANHLMTSIAEGGYGEIMITPAQMLDFSGGVGVVQWDLSTQRDSVRDWPDVWITPWADNVALPTDVGAVDLQGFPREGVHVSMQNNHNIWSLKSFSNFDNTETVINDGTSGAAFNDGIMPGTNQAATRQTFRLTVSRTHLRLERLASATATAIVFDDADIPDLGFTQGVVQFGHHSYNPTKDGSGIPGTWHWDNLTVTPAQAFTIIHTHTRSIEFDNRDANGIIQGTGAITFDAPAPANSWLRFAAVGSVQFSVDAGATWTQAVAQTPQINGPNLASSYFMPIPPGVQTVLIHIGPDSWYTNWPVIAQDFAIFSLGGTPPTSTPTPIVATPTPMASPTATPIIPTPTATVPPTLTATPQPTATGTPLPPTSTPSLPKRDCTVRWGGNTVSDFGQLTQAQCAAIGH